MFMYVHIPLVSFRVRNVHTCKESEDECKTLCKQIVEEWLRREAEKKRREEEEEEEKARQLNGGCCVM